MATSPTAILDLEKQLEKLKVGPPPPAPASSSIAIRARASNTYTSVPSFSDQTCIGRFRIKQDKSYTTQGTDFAKLVPKTSYKGLTGRDLSVGFKTATLIDNYQKYHELKQEFFMKWLMEEEYFTKHPKPDFICFGGRITDPLMSPLMDRFADWDVYATKFQNVIYLWDEKKGEDRVTKDLASYYGIYFEHLLTNADATASVPNEYDKVYVVNQIKFGAHQLLVLNEVDAVDEDGELVELKVYKQCQPRGMKAKYTKYWAQSIVPGIKKLVIGRRDGNGRLQEIVSTTTDEIAIKHQIDARTCLEFEDRLLKWMKECFKNEEDDGNVVKKFSWICGNGSATVKNVPKQNIPKYLIPEWFVEQMKKNGVKK